MTVLVVASILLIGIGGFALFRRSNEPEPEARSFEPSRAYPGLFEHQQDQGTPEEIEEATRLKVQKQTEALVDRLEAGDLTALEEAHRDKALYEAVINAAVQNLQLRQDALKPIVTCIVQSKELRATTVLAQAALKQWQGSPEAFWPPDVLHISALSDDAYTFQKAMEAVLAYSRERSFLPAEKLRALIESEYWVLSSEARRSPAGFVLKGEIASGRREFEKASLRTEG